MTAKTAAIETIDDGVDNVDTNNINEDGVNDPTILVEAKPTFTGSDNDDDDDDDGDEGDDDDDGDEETPSSTGGSSVEEDIALIEKSAGWNLSPKVQLAAWDPEDKKQWELVGRRIARRNILVSIPNLTCCFGVWMVWSVIASKIQKMHDIDNDLYPFQDWGSPQGQEYRTLLFLLPAVSGLAGGTLRIPNSFIIQVVGGRNVVFSTTLLCALPMIITGIALQYRNCPFNVLLVAALLSGTGGGAFASFMSNISFYYPKRLQGMALGYNGGLGNLGVSITQLITPLVMAIPSKNPVSDIAEGTPSNAGWLWLCLCIPCAIAAYFYLSNQPNHGEKNHCLSLVYFYWMEIVGFIASAIGVVTLVGTNDSKLVQSPAGQVVHKFLIVELVALAAHVFVWFITPPKAKVRVHRQVSIFYNKHTYIMTWLYIMCFGSFIGYSGSFPKLIVDLFGYVTVEGCLFDYNSFIQGESKATCDLEGGTWMTEYEVVNPNAPDGAKVAWLGAAVGSLIRPVGGILSDHFGGAKCTMIAVIWCTVVAFGMGFLVKATRELAQPEENYGWFIFFFLNLFLCTGFMNGSTFRTMGVLFPPEEAGPVLGWSSAIASYGSFIIPTMFGISLQAGQPENTFFGLGGYYISCAFLNFWYYLRPGCEKPGV